MVIILLLLSVFWFSACQGDTYTAAQTEAEFVYELENVPIHLGYEQDHSQTAFFDSPQGRVVSIVLVGDVEPAYVYEFYEETLPVLGWSKISENVYYYNAEVLKINVLNDGSVIQLDVAPAEAAN